MGALDEVGYRLRTLSAGSLRRLGFREETYLVLPAAIVGVIAAAAAAGFHELILLLRDTLYRPFLYEGGRWLWLLVLLPALGGLGVGLLVKLFRAPAGHGVVDVMASVAQSRGFQRPRTAIEKILTSGLTIGSGGSAGAEGPIVQIGAALSTLVGRLAGVTRTQMPILVGCGAAAGISAIFNAPIGGVLFTLEVILLDFSLRTFTPVVVAAVIANVTTKAIYDGLARPEAEAVSHYGAIFGEVHLDATIDVLLDWPQLGNYLLLGVVCGVLAMGFTRAMLGGERMFGRLAWLGVFRPAVGGLGVGVLGVTLLMLAGGKFFP
ncbi:MAG: chloride channel protein, partial [Planctomycetota bacterium]